VSQEGPGQTANGRTTDDVAAEPVGTVAEEAAKLLGAVSDWAKDHGSDLGQGVAGLAGQAARSAHEVNEHVATGAAECAYCPLCRAVHALRSTSPEVRVQLATAATSLLQAASTLLATAVPDARREPSDGVEHIDLDDADDWPEDSPDDSADEHEETDR
jgi:hypothetical protein